MEHLPRINGTKEFPAGYHELAQSFPALQGKWLPALSRIITDQELINDPELAALLTRYCCYSAASNEAFTLVEVSYTRLTSALDEIQSDDFPGFDDAVKSFRGVVDSNLVHFSEAWRTLTGKFPKLTARLTFADREKPKAAKIGPMIESLNAYSRSGPSVAFDLKKMREDMERSINEWVRINQPNTFAVDRDLIARVLERASIPKLLFTDPAARDYPSSGKALGLAIDFIGILTADGPDGTRLIAQEIAAARKRAQKVAE